MARLNKASDDFLKQFEEDMKFMEERLKILRAEYNQYFIGARKELPQYTEIQIQKVVRKYAGDKQLKGTFRFKYYNMVARFTMLREFWGRRLRYLEEGLQIGTRAHLEQGKGSPYKHMALRSSSSVIGSSKQKVIRDPVRQQSDIRLLYLNYIRAIRKQTGDEISLPFTQFKQQIVEKYAAIKSKRNCEGVQFRIATEDGNVRIKAKAVKEDDAAPEPLKKPPTR